MDKKTFNVECNNILQDFKDGIISRKEALQALNSIFDRMYQPKVESVSDDSKMPFNDNVEYLKDMFGMK